MLPNGFTDSWMLLARSGTPGGILLTGCTESVTQRIGLELAAKHRTEFIRLSSYIELPEEP